MHILLNKKFYFFPKLKNEVCLYLVLWKVIIL